MIWYKREMEAFTSIFRTFTNLRAFTVTYITKYCDGGKIYLNIKGFTCFKPP
jgi:hypothetical protein